MKSRTNFKKRLISVAIASVLTGLGSHAAANDFTIENGALTISNTGFNQAVTVGVNGVIPSVTGVPLADSFGIPNFSFNLVNEADVKTNGTYAFKVGVVIDDDNSDRRIEAYLGTLNMTVSNSGNTLTGSIPAQNLVVIGRDDATNVTRLLSNGATNGPISISGGSVSFNGATLVSRLRGSNPIFDAIFDSFNTTPGHYTYTVVIEKTSGPDVRFGLVNAGSFSPLPQARTVCALSPASELSSVFELLGTVSNAAFRVNEQFSAAFAVQGQFSVAGAGGVAAAAPTAFTDTCVAPPANVPPTASIEGGAQTFNDTDGVAGETVSLTGNAADSDGTIKSTKWLVGGAEVATGTKANIALPDGQTNVTFRVTDDDDAVTDSTVVITVGVPTPPEVSIDGGDRDVADTDGLATEEVELTASATDADGTIATTEWFVGGVSSGSGNSIKATLPVGPTVVTFKATDNAGLSDETSVTITVLAPVNTPPVVAINQGSFTQIDTDGKAGETVSLSASATDNGSIASTEWTVNGTPAGSGLSLDAVLNNGSNTVSFKATDNLGLSSETSVTIFVEEANTSPTVSVTGPTSIIDTDGKIGETVTYTASVIDAENNVTSTEWILNGSSIGSGDSISVDLPDGSSTLEFKATDAGGLSASASVGIIVGPPIPPTTSVAGGDRTIIDTNAIDGEPVVFSGTAADADGTLASIEWLVDGAPAGSGLSPTIQLPNGDSVVSIRAVDNVGLISTSSVNIRVQPPVPPIVTINGGDRIVVDTNGLAGELVSVTGTARDPDGTIALAEWLIAGAVVATGLEAQLQVPNGVTAVTFRARDNVGLVRTASVNITVRPPVVPVVSINGGDRNVIDTNGLPGETLAFAATAADLDGSIVETTWLLNGAPAGTGLTTSIPVPNGNNVVTFTARDNVGLTASASVNINVAAPVAPVVSILGGSRTVNHTNVTGVTTVDVSGAAADADGSIVSTEWLVGGNVVATGTSASLTLPNGANTVTFRATDNTGVSSTASATITVVSRIAPVVSIVGGSRTVADTNNIAGEAVVLTATATDANGTIASTEWLVGGSVVATGLSATLTLPDGGTAVTFRATDNDGQSTSTTATVTVVSALPNTPPVITITAPTTVPDSDGLPGQDVAVTAVATDVGGSVSLIEWQVGGEVVATGASAVLSLPNGSTTVTARAIDNLGASTTTSATINVLAPAAPVVAIDGGSRTIVDTNGVPGEFVTVSASATDSDGTIVSSQWLVGGTVVANGTSATLNLPEGANTVSFRATDNVGLTSTATATLTVNAPVAPVVSILTANLNIPDSNSRPGEPVSLFGTATDADGTIVTSQWLVNGTVVSTGLAADLVLADGTSSVEFRATDNSGMTSSASTTVVVQQFIPPPTEAEVNQGAQNQRDTAARLRTLIETNPQAAAAEAGAAALEAAAKAASLRRAADTGSASNSAIANGLGAMSQAVSSATRAGAGATDQNTRNQINAQAKETVANSSLLLSQMAENAASTGVGLTIEEEQQVQQASSNLLDTTTDIARNVTNTDELLDVVNAANRITESNQRLGIPATPELVAKTAAASLEIATKVAAQALAELGSNLSESEIRTALSANPNALQTVIDSALKIPPTTTKTQVQKNQEATANAGANPPAGLVDRLAAASGTAVDPRTVQIGGISALQAITNLFGAIGLEALTVTMIDANGRIASVTNLESGAAQIKVDDATGLVTLSLPGETYAGAIVGVRSVPATVPTGIRFRADGRGLIVNNGFAIEIAPAPISLVKFVTAVERSGFPFRLNPNASITLQVGNGERFSGTFAYDNLTGIDLAACGDLSFIEPTGALNSAGYAFGVRCANGALQHVVPFIESSTFNDSVRAFGLTPSTDRNTGFVTVPTVGVFKPNFFVLAPTPEERVFHNTNKDAFGNAVQYLDANGDGKLDVKLITATGTQLLYGVN
ncbi:MAG: hypothetical protein Q8S94_08100 [Pseudohongiella sp.]|nr:hypothetical protein [Pseudohongiella sp.]